MNSTATILRCSLRLCLIGTILLVYGAFSRATAQSDTSNCLAALRTIASRMYRVMSDPHRSYRIRYRLATYSTDNHRVDSASTLTQVTGRGGRLHSLSGDTEVQQDDSTIVMVSAKKRSLYVMPIIHREPLPGEDYAKLLANYDTLVAMSGGAECHTMPSGAISLTLHMSARGIHAYGFQTITFDLDLAHQRIETFALYASAGQRSILREISILGIDEGYADATLDGPACAPFLDSNGRHLPPYADYTLVDLRKQFVATK